LGLKLLARGLLMRPAQL